MIPYGPRYTGGTDESPGDARCRADATTLGLRMGYTDDELNFVYDKVEKCGGPLRRPL